MDKKAKETPPDAPDAPVSSDELVLEIRRVSRRYCPDSRASELARDIFEIVEKAIDERDAAARDGQRG